MAQILMGNPQQQEKKKDPLDTIESVTSIASDVYSIGDKASPNKTEDQSEALKRRKNKQSMF